MDERQRVVRKLIEAMDLLVESGYTPQAALQEVVTATVQISDSYGLDFDGAVYNGKKVYEAEESQRDQGKI